uniref:Uncharacterized protein n=1 Tax=viral metagenome TaxID=1070528 RepID=A0A6M3JMI9_9ZZZZ
MGFYDWLRKKLNIKDESTVYKIERIHLAMPKDDECVIFKFPIETPREVISNFDNLLVEFQNSSRRFISTNLEIDLTISKKDKMQIEGDKNSKSDITVRDAKTSR